MFAGGGRGVGVYVLLLTSSAEGGAVVRDPLGVGGVGAHAGAVVLTVLQLVGARVCKVIHIDHRVV